MTGLEDTRLDEMNARLRHDHPPTAVSAVWNLDHPNAPKGQRRLEDFQ